MSGHILFVNQPSYIRVVNSLTGVKAHVSKIGLLIQKNNEETFFLKSDTFYGFYKFADIQTSETTVDDLIDVLINFVEEYERNKNSGGDSALSVSGPNFTRMIDIRSNYKYSTSDKLKEVTEGGSTVTYDKSKGMTKFELGTSSPQARAVRSTQDYIPDGFVSNIIVMQEAVLNGLDSEAQVPSDVLSRVGIFENKDDLTVNETYGGRGAFFEHYLSSGTTYAVLRYNNESEEQVDVKVPSTDWNIDTLDGVGRSGKTLDPMTKSVYVFDYDPVRKTVKLGVLFGDRITYAHEFKNPELQLMQVPMRWELVHTNSEEPPTDAAIFFQGRGSVFHTDNPNTNEVSFHMTGNSKSITSPTPIYSLRLKTAANRSKISLKKLEIMNSMAGGMGRWELRRNPTLTGENFVDYGGSAAQVSTEETDLSDGEIIASGFLFDSGVTSIDLTEKDLALLSSLAGEPEVVTLYIHNVGGALDITSGISWREYA